MTNSPPPDRRRSSLLSFDEWVGIIIALGAMGAILFVFLGQRDGGLEVFRGQTPSTPEARESPTSTAETPSPQSRVPTTLPSSEQLMETFSAPAAPQGVSSQ